MPLIDANRKGKTVKLQVDLDRETNARLNKYVRYSRADKHKVVAGALQLLFKEDKEFGPWLKAHPPRKRGDGSALRTTDTRASASSAQAGDGQ